MISAIIVGALIIVSAGKGSERAGAWQEVAE